MTQIANDWCTVHNTTQGFTVIPEIGQLLKEWKQKVVILAFFYFLPCPCMV